MSITQQQLDGFYRFASDQIQLGGADTTFLALFDEWRIQNPSSPELHENVQAIKAALRDMENGQTGRSFGEFAAEFRQRNNIPNEV
jgi:hypothetical protein